MAIVHLDIINTMIHPLRRSPETMNFQGLYQAVRSRLHFSQVAAWWSRSNGIEPNYVATRVVPYNEDNLRKFRDSPVEHTFPLAGNGDGSSIKVKYFSSCCCFFSFLSVSLFLS